MCVCFSARRESEPSLFRPQVPIERTEHGSGSTEAHGEVQVARIGAPRRYPVRFGPGPLWAEIERAVDALPTVVAAEPV